MKLKIVMCDNNNILSLGNYVAARIILYLIKILGCCIVDNIGNYDNQEF